MAINGLYAESVDDLFGELAEDAAEEKKELKKPTTIWSQISDNFKGEIEARYMAHDQYISNGTDLDNRKHFIEGLFDYESSFKLGKEFSFFHSGWFEYGNQKHTYGGITDVPTDIDDRRNIWEVDQVYATSSVGSLDVTAGRKVVKNSVNTLYSPADRLWIPESNDPLNVKEIGNWMVALDYYLGDTTFSYILMPWFNPPKEPHESNRWYGSSDDTTGASAVNNLASSEDYPGFNIKKVQNFAKIKTTVKGFDFFVSGYYGRNASPVVRRYDYYVTTTTPLGITTRQKVSDFIKDYVQVLNYAAGLSTTLDNWELHGEFFYQNALADKDDDFIAFAPGATFTIDESVKKFSLDKIDITGEYAREVIKRYQSHHSYEQSSEGARYGRNNWLTRIIIKVNEDLRFAYGNDLDLNTGGNMHNLGVEYKFHPGWEYSLNGELISGKSGSYWGQWRQNDRIVSSLKYTF